MPLHTHDRPEDATAESGFALVMALVVLLLLTLFGAWALQTSTFELEVAGSLQQADRQLNLADGGAYLEAARAGLVGKSLPLKNTTSGREAFYTIHDKKKAGPLLAPTHGPVAPYIPQTWPADNLVEDAGKDAGQYEYRYLAEFLSATGKPTLGDQANKTGGAPPIVKYRYRFRGNASGSQTVVEIGGVTTGK